MPGQQASPEQLARMRQAAASNQEAKKLYETLTEEPPNDMPPPRSHIPVEERVREIEMEIDCIYQEGEQA